MPLPKSSQAVLDVRGARSSVASKFLWTTGIYVSSIGVRFLTSVILSRLLGPGILGVMVLVNTVRIGAELLADLGLEQNVIHSPHGDEERYLNTVWTMQITRGLVLSVVCVALAPFLSRLYGMQPETLLAISAAPLLNALASTSVFSLSKRLDVKRRNLFELAAESVGLVINIALALVMPTVWAPILGVLLTLGLRSALTYLLPHPKHRLVLDRTYLHATIRFGKWITLSSISFYAALYIDRLFLGWAVNIAVLGMYGLARTISDLPAVLATRLGYLIIFPMIAADKEAGGSAARADLAPTRGRFLTLLAVGIATLMAWSDWTVMILYDNRYRDAGWMLFLLLAGSWMSVLSSLNESAVFGRGKPQIASLASVIRIIVLVAALPIGYAMGGLPGAIFAVPVAELSRYVALMIGQWALGISFARQDAAISLGLVAVLAAWIAVRLYLGLGIPWALMS